MFNNLYGQFRVFFVIVKEWDMVKLEIRRRTTKGRCINMFFKDEYHQKLAEKLMKQFGFNSLEDDREYGAFCYVASATYKEKDLLNIASTEGIDLDELEQKMGVYSNSERSMIRFGLQLFNSGIDDISLPDVLHSLDEQNEKVIVQSILFRYKIKL